MFEAKALVAVVMPALATSISAISSIAVLQMQRLTNRDEKVKAVWLSRGSNGPVITPTSVERPNKQCAICGAELWELRCDFATTKCIEIGKAVGASSPSISINGVIVFDADDSDAITKCIAATRLKNGDIVSVSDLDGEDGIVTVILRAEEPFGARCLHRRQFVAAPAYDPADWDDSDVELVD
jgi:hypothetical protein